MQASHPVGLFIELEKGLSPAILGMITSVRQSQTQLYALTFDGNHDEIESYREILQSYGISKLIVVKMNGHLGNFNPKNWVEALIETMNRFHIKSLVGLSNGRGKIILPLLAAFLQAPLAMRCLSIDLKSHIIEKALYSGKTIAKIKLHGDHFIYGILPNVVDPIPEPISVPIETIVFESTSKKDKSYLYGEILKGSHENDITQAEIIVSGGRGLGNKENFNILKECAHPLKAAVGASRVAVDNGWAPYSMQVGQTGSKVRPKVYIACGISGSVQHLAGMKNSKMIIAINHDPKAPIVSKCDYYINYDLFVIIPLLTKKLLKTMPNEK